MASDVQLKVWFFAFGIILLFSGLPTMAVSNLSHNESYATIIEYVGDDKSRSWEVAAYFEKGDSIVVDYRPDTSWADPPYEFSDEFPNTELKIIYLNLTAPNGNYTYFCVILGKVPDKQMVAQMKIEVMRDYSTDGLNVSDYPDKVGGIAEYSGIYKLVVRGPGPSEETGEEALPFALYLSKKYSQTVYPLAFLLPVGAIVTLSGLGLTAWSVKRPRRRVTYRKAKTSRIAL